MDVHGSSIPFVFLYVKLQLGFHFRRVYQAYVELMFVCGLNAWRSQYLVHLCPGARPWALLEVSCLSVRGLGCHLGIFLRLKCPRSHFDASKSRISVMIEKAIVIL